MLKDAEFLVPTLAKVKKKFFFKKNVLLSLPLVIKTMIRISKKSIFIKSIMYSAIKIGFSLIHKLYKKLPLFIIEFDKHKITSFRQKK